MPTLENPEGSVLGGKYRVIRRLGAGGMGEVLLAQHTELDKSFAIKVMNADIGEDPVALERFMREARAVTRITSEHVVRVFDVGRFDDGRPYIVMEYLEGEDLASRLERGPLSVREAVGWVLQACVAIAEAHRVGVIHRDLKPGNLFIVRKRDGTEVLKVVDFGISKVQSRHGRAEASLTKTGHLVGSPFYMSPEQLRGGADLDGRTDVWSLGVILFELVTGEGAFDAPTLPEMCMHILSTPARTLSEARSDMVFPEGFEGVVDLCLAKDPQSRFADAIDLAIALGPFAGVAMATASNLPTKPPIVQALHAQEPTRRIVVDAPVPADVIAAVSQARAANASKAPAQKRTGSKRQRTLLTAAIAAIVVLTVALAGVTVVAIVRSGDVVAARSIAPSAAPPPSAVAVPIVTAAIPVTTAPSTTPVASSAAPVSPQSPTRPRPVAAQQPAGGDEFGGRK